MSEKLKTLIVENVDGKEYEFTGGSGGSGSAPAPNSVNSQSIEDESIQKEDLDKSIQDKLDMLDEQNVITEDELSEDWEEAMRQAGIDVDVDVQGSESLSDQDLEDDWEAAMQQASQNGQDSPTPEEPNPDNDDI